MSYASSLITLAGNGMAYSLPLKKPGSHKPAALMSSWSSRYCRLACEGLGLCAFTKNQSALQCRNLQYQIAARIINATEPASWATGPYLPYPKLNITGHVLVRPCACTLTVWHVGLWASCKTFILEE